MDTAAIISAYPFLRGMDPGRPDEVRADGSRVWNVRCRVPFSAPAGEVSRAGRDQTRAIAGTRAAAAGSDGEAGMAGHMPGEDDAAMMVGVASSTSVDFYGTEMSPGALRSMAEQMTVHDGSNGIPYLPRHSNGMSGPLEWDEVIGRTVYAEVVPADEVRAAYNPNEQQFVLRTTIKLFPDEPVAQAMMRRIARGERIGQSIGGWFTQLQVVQNEDGEVQRVIVQGVELDHLAATRAPANPDSHEVVQLRSALSARLARSQARAESDAPGYGPRPDAAMSCATCQFFTAAGLCQRYQFVAIAGNGCDSWTADYNRPEAQEQRMVNEFADLPIAPEETEWTWDAAAQNAILESGGWDLYRAAHLWSDPERAEVKDGYKLAIALMVNGRLHAVWRGVAAAMSVLNGGRGGADITEQERQDAYRHLVRYYEKLGKEPPPLAALSTLSVAREAIQNRHILSVETEGDDVVVVRFAREYESEESGPMDLEDEDTNEVELNRIAVSVDSVQRARQDTCGSDVPTDARGSAPLVPATEQESKMPEQNGMTLDALSALLDSKLAPLAERVQQLESGAPKATVAPKGQTTDLDVALARAKAAEEKLATVLAQPNRIGRSQLAHQIPTGPLAPTGIRGIVDRARSDARPAVTVAAVAERMVDAVTVQPGKAPANLRDHLAALLDAAMADGLLTNPADRSQWA
jgi:hypothetical protein